MRGKTDYTLAKRALLAEFRRGLLTRTDLCDAHPELMRAAKNIGREVPRPCPVCSEDTLREVSYVYGDQLKQLSGRVVYPAGWVDELRAAHDEFRRYDIEVCVSCAWNHLAACTLMGRRYAEKPAEQGRAEPRRRRAARTRLL